MMQVTRVAAAALMVQLSYARAAPPDIAAATGLIVEETNAFRAAQGLPPLAREARLAQAAREFAEFMARTGKFGHGADGAQPAGRARRHGYDYCLVSENLGYQYRSRGFGSAAELAGGFVEGWKRSPGHRKNLADRDATEIGVGIARSSSTGRYYAVQMFGRPASLAVEFTVVNESDARLEYRVGSTAYALPRRSLRTHTECVAEPVVAGGRARVPVNGDRFVVR